MEQDTAQRHAGRPPLFYGGKMKKYKICLDENTVRKARMLSAANELSDGIRKAVAAAYEITGPAPEAAAQERTK